VPDKPDRPLLSATFDDRPLVVESFPRESEALEAAWAQRFVEALERQYAIRYSVAGRPAAGPPGDAVLRADGEPDVLLEITEAIDHNRRQLRDRRDLYFKATAKAEPRRLESAFSGVQIAIDDSGRARQLPEPNTQEGRAVAKGLASFILSLEARASALAVGEVTHPREMMQRHFIEPSSKVALMVSLRRYAPVADAKPAQGYWGGAAWTIGEVAPHYIFEAIKAKCLQYSKIRQPFWLLAYTVDCAYSLEEETAIQSYLASITLPFGKIFILNPSRTRQVFPPLEDPKTAPGPQRTVILGGDLVPKVNDPRFKDI
jgi:hypothetical protein